MAAEASSIAPSLTAVIFLDGAYEEASFYRDRAAEADLLVAADGGARFLLEEGVLPHLVVGDFDSLADCAVARLATGGVEIVRHPVRKDLTDGELAVGEALRRGAAEVLLVGALGALDHTLGHLSLLWSLEDRGIPAAILAPHLCASVVAASASGGVALDAPSGTRVSLMPVGGDAVVSLRGFAYPLVNGALRLGVCLGVGNTVVEDAAVSIAEGAVVVMVSWGHERFGRARASS